jgi:hypothetical protein
MDKTKVSNTVTIIRGATPQELDRERMDNRTWFVQRIERSPALRMPAGEDLDHWWPTTPVRASLTMPQAAVFMDGERVGHQTVSMEFKATSDHLNEQVLRQVLGDDLRSDV